MVFMLTLITHAELSAAQLQLSWTDNSTGEDGFKVERGTLSSGPFTQIGTTASNITSYTDSGLADAATFCYRVKAYNTAAESGYTSVACATTKATLTASKVGSGTVSSSPAGISCGATCSGSFTAGTAVTLTAAAGSGYSFTGWSGACTGTGSCVVTMDAAKSALATFTIQSFALTLSKAGTGSGTVTSSPAGINCGATCSSNYNSGTAATLTPAPAAGSVFAGWSGACTGTGSCVVTMDAAKSVSASFNVAPPPAPSALSIL
jgi:hypothetical protein